MTYPRDDPSPVKHGTMVVMPSTLETVEVMEPVTDEVNALDRPWIVLVWNDPLNLMSYVTYVFQKLFGFSLEKAT